MIAEPPASFGELLRRYRAAVGLTQEELAARTGLTPQAISLLECGQRRHPQAYTVSQLAEALALTAPERHVFAAVARHPLLSAPAAAAWGSRPARGGSQRTGTSASTDRSRKAPSTSRRPRPRRSWHSLTPLGGTMLTL